MLDPTNIPPVENNERVARFVLYRSHIRNDGTVKPDAFIPHPHTDLSVTRHRQAEETEIWAVGEEIANQRQMILYGRADTCVRDYTNSNLTCAPDPIDGNPNHANISGWPTDKAAQKMLAQQIAAASQYVSHHPLPGRQTEP